MNVKRIIWLVVSMLIILFGMLWMLIDFSEFYIVAIKNQDQNYPWGYVNENPWYYYDSTIYSIYCLVSGSLFLFATILTSFGVIKNKTKITVIGSIIIITLFLIMVLSAYITDPIA